MFAIQIKYVLYIYIYICKKKKCYSTGLLQIQYTFLEIYSEQTNCPVQAPGMYDTLLSLEIITEILFCLKLESDLG
jgi:hypothetical protein